MTTREFFNAAQVSARHGCLGHWVDRGRGETTAFGDSGLEGPKLRLLKGVD
jgi:hypothetical protein